MKTIATLLLAGLMLFGLVACSLEEAAETDAETTPEATEGETEPAVTTAEITTAAAATAAETTAPEPAPEPITLKIVTANVQNANYDKSGEPTLDSKYRKLAAAFSAKTPDLVFLPECGTAEAAEAIRNRMANASSYEVVAGEGANVMMLYNTDVFALVDKGCLQIGAKGDANGSNYDRHLVWARLRHIESGTRMVVAPIHVDYATTACKEQINTIVFYLKNNFPKIPFVLGGDFNQEMRTVGNTALVTEGYQNAGTTATAKINGNESTFPEKGIVIDFLWYKSGMAYTVKSDKYEVIMDALPTDHRPIYVELTITKQQ
jgi:endonuclease/exonuclease/phosphatase (EEP) superfamily protein YafD